MLDYAAADQIGISLWKKNGIFEQRLLGLFNL
jgi:hypothetical protein